jgi:hypothetical protein
MWALGWVKRDQILLEERPGEIQTAVEIVIGVFAGDEEGGVRLTLSRLRSVSRFRQLGEK